MRLLEERDSHNLSLLICLIASLSVILRMLTGSQLFLLLFISLVTFGIVVDKVENKLLYILYFVPWAFAIKFNFDQMSLLTVLSALYCVICVIYILLNKTSLSIFYISVIVALFIYSFFSLLISNSASLTGILSFLLNFVVIYFAILFVKDKKVIATYILFHALGLTVSGWVNLLGNRLPMIQAYISSYTQFFTVNTSTILYTRFAGLDLDPNYFAIQALLAIACVSILLFSNQIKLIPLQKTLAYFTLISLSIMGVLTLSKMFLISFGLLIAVVLILLFKENVKKGFYYLLFISSGLGLVIFTFYDYFYQAFFFRFFFEGSSASSITTGRSDIWLAYYLEITGDAQLLFLGNGISDQFLNDTISHNMYLIAWYYLGIIGLSLFILLFVALYRQLNSNFKQRNNFPLFSIYIIPLLITLFANLSLDSFIMDYFGVHVFLILLVLSLNEDERKKVVPLVAVDT